MPHSSRCFIWLEWDYLSSIGYEPNGAVHSMNYGNGAIEVDTHNKRLQPQESALQTNAGGVLGTVYDKQYVYNQADTSYCSGLQVADDGSIHQIVDTLSGNRSQSFQVN